MAKFCIAATVYLDFRGVIVVARWECGRGLALGLSPVTGSLACVFFPLCDPDSVCFCGLPGYFSWLNRWWSQEA